MGKKTEQMEVDNDEVLVKLPNTSSYREQMEVMLKDEATSEFPPLRSPPKMEQQSGRSQSKCGSTSSSSSDATNAIVSTVAHDNAAHTIISAAANAIVITAACVIVVLLRSVGGRTTSHAAGATMSVSVSDF